MPLRLGLDAKLYLKPGGIAGSSPWIEMGNAKDVTLSIETGEADVTTRANNGWKASVPTLKEAKIETTLVWDTTDPGFLAIQQAFFQNVAIGVAAMDGAITVAGSQGLQADMGITSFVRKEPLEEALAVEVTLKVFYSQTPPQWVTVGAVPAP